MKEFNVLTATKAMDKATNLKFNNFLSNTGSFLANCRLQFPITTVSATKWPKMLLMMMLMLTIGLQFQLFAHKHPHFNFSCLRIGILTITIVLSLNILNFIAQSLGVQVKCFPIALADMGRNILYPKNLMHCLLSYGHELRWCTLLNAQLSHLGIEVSTPPANWMQVNVALYHMTRHSTCLLSSTHPKPPASKLTS